jgi:hypothetical protein
MNGFGVDIAKICTKQSLDSSRLFGIVVSASLAIRTAHVIFNTKWSSHNMKYSIAVIACAVLAGCGGGSSAPPVMGVATNTTLATNATTAAAVANTPFTFSSGVAALGTTGSTSVTFTSTTATPAFSIASGGNTATGTTTFGSCIFAVTSSNFPAGHSLALGQTVTVNPCNLSVNTTGAVANGVATSRSVALLLGAAASSGSSVIIAVTSGGALTLNGSNVGTVTLTPVSGG